MRPAAHRALLDHEHDGAPTTLAWLLPGGLHPRARRPRGAGRHLAALAECRRGRPQAPRRRRPAPAAGAGHPHHPGRPAVLAPGPRRARPGPVRPLQRRPRRAVRRLARRARPARRPAWLGDLVRRRRCRPRPGLARPQRRPPGRRRAVGAHAQRAGRGPRRCEHAVAPARRPPGRPRPRTLVGVAGARAVDRRHLRGRGVRPAAAQAAALGVGRADLAGLARPVPRHGRPLAHPPPSRGEPTRPARPVRAAPRRAHRLGRLRARRPRLAASADRRRGQRPQPPVLAGQGGAPPRRAGHGRGGRRLGRRRALARHRPGHRGGRGALRRRADGQPRRRRRALARLDRRLDRCRSRRARPGRPLGAAAGTAHVARRPPAPGARPGVRRRAGRGAARHPRDAARRRQRLPRLPSRGRHPVAAGRRRVRVGDHRGGGGLGRPRAGSVPSSHSSSCRPSRAACGCSPPAGRRRPARSPPPSPRCCSVRSPRSCSPWSASWRWCSPSSAPRVRVHALVVAIVPVAVLAPWLLRQADVSWPVLVAGVGLAQWGGTAPDPWQLALLNPGGAGAPAGLDRRPARRRRRPRAPARPGLGNGDHHADPPRARVPRARPRGARHPARHRARRRRGGGGADHCCGRASCCFPWPWCSCWRSRAGLDGVPLRRPESAGRAPAVARRTAVSWAWPPCSSRPVASPGRRSATSSRPSHDPRPAVSIDQSEGAFATRALFVTPGTRGAGYRFVGREASDVVRPLPAVADADGSLADRVSAALGDASTGPGAVRRHRHRPAGHPVRAGARGGAPARRHRRAAADRPARRLGHVAGQPHRRRRRPRRAAAAAPRDPRRCPAGHHHRADRGHHDHGRRAAGQPAGRRRAARLGRARRRRCRRRDRAARARDDHPHLRAPDRHEHAHRHGHRPDALVARRPGASRCCCSPSSPSPSGGASPGWVGDEPPLRHRCRPAAWRLRGSTSRASRGWCSSTGVGLALVHVATDRPVDVDLVAASGEVQAPLVGTSLATRVTQTCPGPELAGIPGIPDTTVPVVGHGGGRAGRAAAGARPAARAGSSPPPAPPRCSRSTSGRAAPRRCSRARRARAPASVPCCSPARARWPRPSRAPRSGASTARTCAGW